MAKGISEIVGEASCVGKSRVTIYRALKILICAKCSETINEGELFTRRSLYGHGLRILPQCQKCSPFQLRAGDRDRSALVEALLTPEEMTSAKPITRELQEKTAEAIEKRLGPALRHMRRARSQDVKG
jgi:Fe2+ or Zn2+ uptake regulation protein